MNKCQRIRRKKRNLVFGSTKSYGNPQFDTIFNMRIEEKNFCFFLLRTQTFIRLNLHRYLNWCARVIIFLLLLLSFWGSHLRCCCYYEFFLKFRFHSTEDSNCVNACIFTIFVGAHNFMCYKLMCQILRFYNHIDRFIPLVFWYMFIVNCIENAIYLSIMHINIVCNANDGIFNVYLFRS